MRWRRGVLLVLAGPVIYALAATVGAFVPGPRASVPAGGATVEVLMIAGPIHYDLLLPADAGTLARFGFARAAGVPLGDPRVRWLVVGWGAREFYTTTGSYGDVSARAVWRGLTGDGSVMRIDVASALPAKPPARRLRMGQLQYNALLGAIEAGFARDAGGQPVPVAGAGLSRTDAFFAGVGRFHAFRTSNTWIGRTLRAAGLRFGAWTPFPYSVALSHWLWQS